MEELIKAIVKEVRVCTPITDAELNAPIPGYLTANIMSRIKAWIADRCGIDEDERSKEEWEVNVIVGLKEEELKATRRRKRLNLADANNPIGR